MTPVSLTLSRAWRNCRQCWRDLALTDIAYKVLAFIVLTPLTGLLLHILIALSGRTVVADEDIIQFLLEPLGWLCIVSVGAIWIAILALEQTALLGVLGAAEANQHMRVTQAITFAASHGWSVLRVTLRMVALALLAAAPFLTIAGITYLSLLTKFDINFYLQQKPREFQIAIGIGVLLGIGLAVVLLRLATSWFFALPLVVFEGVAPSDALRVSRERARGHRPRTVFWIVAWLLVTFLLSALATGTVTLIAKGLVPQFLHRLPLLLFIVGATVVAWATVNLIVNLISATTFAVIFFRLYADYGSPEGVNTSRLDAVEATMRKSRFSLTRTRLAIVATVALIVSAAVGAYAIRTVRPTDDALIIAHRGASAAAPENTMASIEQAVAEKTDWTEIDVQETADGQVVVFHDSDFKKIADVDLKIWDATMEDLQKIDIGSWFDPKFQDQRVPTLAQVLEYCHGKTKLTIELKYYGHDQNLEQKVADLVVAAGMESDVVIISLKEKGLQKMKKIRPDWKTGLLTAMAVGDLTNVDADFLAVNANIANRAFIRSAHQRDKEVLVWTVNDPITISSMIGRGADGLITDKPALAREVLAARRSLSAVERMLIELAGLLGVEREVTEQ